MRSSIPAQASMTPKATPVARLLGRVTSCALHRRTVVTADEQLSAATCSQWLAARQSSTAAARTLAGKNIFQLRAAVETVEPATAQNNKQQPQEQKIIALPTSDASEKLLKIRHSVSFTAATIGVHMTPISTACRLICSR